MTDAGSDVLDVLAHDHREVEQMFARLQALPATPETADQRKTLAEQVVIELVRHSVAEEEYVYPAARKALPGGAELVELEVEEHQRAEQTMNELEDVGPDDPSFMELVTRLAGQVKEHVANEEGQLFPRLREALPLDERTALGAQVQQAKRTAPTRPHPKAPNHPPFNKLASPGAALVDRVRDFLSGRGKG